ncbi:DndE family protein [Thiomicrorhabdus indica]|uniref:DndE family protein n=1 Tax=Thiomicrorhabdus indica TaxID=2267253 RepID=UPI00102D8A39|nr:DndE family protein [Thiomicrorhabdus indica]
MINLPNEITLSRSVTNKFSVIKQRTGVSPNLLSRVALMKALESDVQLSELKDFIESGQKIPKDIAFGEDSDIYRLALEMYANEQSFTGDFKVLVNNLIEYGAHSIPQVKAISDFAKLP